MTKTDLEHALAQSQEENTRLRKELGDLRILSRAMGHCIQSAWRALPSEFREQYVNDESIATSNRLPYAVAAFTLWKAGAPMIDGCKPNPESEAPTCPPTSN